MIKKILSIFCLLALSVGFMYCGSDDDPKTQEPTEKEKVTELLVAGGQSWQPSSSSRITVEGVDVTDEYFEGFSIKFGTNTFTTTGTTPVWLRSDTWEFTDDNATAFIRGQDEKVVTITNISESELNLTLEWDSTTYAEGGRIRSTPGTYVFTLSK